MKNICFKVSLLILLVSCSSSDKVDIRPFDKSNFKDQEVNDSINKPIDVSVQGPIVGFFNDKDNIGDKDYYRVYFPLKGISYKLVQTAVPGIDSKITFFSESKYRLFYIDVGKRGEAEKLWQFFPNKDYIIMLVESKTGYNEKIPYVIEFYPSENNDIDEIEPNNSRDEALPIVIGEERKGLISPKGDIDYYKIISDNDEIYDFSIKIDTFSNLDLNFTIYNLANNTSKIINDNGWGQDEYFPFLSSNKGEFLIKVSGNFSSNDRKNPVYMINLAKTVKAPDNVEEYYEREFNDQSDMATTLVDGTTTLGLFYPKDDVDWYKYDIIRRAVSVNISLSSIRGVNPKLEVYDGNLESLKFIEGNGINKDKDIILNKMKRGKYYIKLSSSENSQQVYRLYLNVRYR